MSRYRRYFNRRGRGYSKRPSWDSRFDTYDPGYEDYLPYSMVGGAFYAMENIEDWRLRGRWYEDYYRNTGYRPRYYNSLKRKRIKG